MALQKNGSKKKGKKGKKTVVIIAVIVLILLFLLLKGCSGGEATVLVTTTAATRGELQESVSTSGTVAAEEVKVFFAPVAGTIAQVKVAPGDAVQMGDVLIAYDETKLDSDFRQATLQQEKSTAGYNSAIADSADNQAKLREANTNIPVLEQQIADNKAYLKDLQSKLNQSQRDTSTALANEAFDLNEELLNIQSEIKALSPSDTAALAEKQARIRQIESDLSRNNYLQQIANSSDYVVEMEEEIQRVQELIADYEEYKAEMEGQKNSSETGVMDSYDKTSYEADKALSDMAYSEAEASYYAGKAGVCAEFAGVVTEVTAVEGSTIAEGVQLLTLESTDAVKVTFSATRQDVAKLEVGQKAEVTISGNVYNGTVSKINRMATVNASNTPMVGVEVHIENPDDKIILGLDAKLTVNTRAVQDALLIPVEAVNADRDGDFLYVVEDGVVVRKAVVCGISNDTHTEILEGVTEQDQIVLTYMGSLEEGMAVTIMPEM